MIISLNFLVLVAGLEPARSLERGILSPLRLPIPPHKRDFYEILNIYTVIFVSKDFKSLASAYSATQAFLLVLVRRHASVFI